MLKAILNFAFHYWWVIAAAFLASELFKAPEGVEAAINEFKPDKNLGGAAFADNKGMKKAKLFEGKGIPIGYSEDGKPLHYNGQGHGFIDCAARGGKGVSMLIPIQLEWDGSLLVIDPKAENVCVVGYHRRKFGEVYVVNPFYLFADKLKGLKHATYNPMDVLDINSPSFHMDCDKIATGVITQEEGRGAYFSRAAVALVSGVIAAVKRYAPKDKQHLVEVARIIADDRGLYKFCWEATKSSDPFIVQKLKRFAVAPWEQPSEEMRGVVATASSNLAFFGNQSIAESVLTSSFRFKDLRRKKGTSIYICLPLEYLDVCDKYFRLLMECFLTELLSERSGSKGRVLAIIDEMAQLGPYMKSLENAQGMISGAAGLIIIGVLQSLVQLQGMFPKTWQVFIQNAGFTAWFNLRSQEDREFVSKHSGMTEVISRTRTANPDRRTGEVVLGESGGQHNRPLLLPHEAGYLDSDEMLLFVEGVNGPIKAKRKPYWKVSKYAGKYRDNPYVNSKGGVLARIFK